MIPLMVDSPSNHRFCAPAHPAMASRQVRQLSEPKACPSTPMADPHSRKPRSARRSPPAQTRSCSTASPPCRSHRSPAATTQASRSPSPLRNGARTARSARSQSSARSAAAGMSMSGRIIRIGVLPASSRGISLPRPLHNHRPNPNDNQPDDFKQEAETP